MNLNTKSKVLAVAGVPQKIRVGDAPIGMLVKNNGEICFVSYFGMDTVQLVGLESGDTWLGINKAGFGPGQGFPVTPLPPGSLVTLEALP